MYEYQGVITGIHDGDTLRMEIDLGFSIHILTPTLNNLPQSLRINGYDAPELGRLDKQGEQARDAFTGLASAHAGPYIVGTVKDHTDKYGRYLVSKIVSVDGIDLVQAMINLGWLRPYTGSGPKPWA
jgi:endonuclease YncB( thermonuclease family)